MPKPRKPRKQSGRSTLDQFTTRRTKRNRLIMEEFQQRLFSGQKLKKQSEKTVIKPKKRNI